MTVRLAKTLFLAPLVLASCTKDFTMQELTSTRVSASAGGIAKSHDGLVEIEFAPGALAADTDIRIEAKRDLMSSEIESRAVYELGPDGLTFEGDVELRFIATDATEELVVVNLDTGEPVELESSSHDLATGVVTAKLEHFSLYALILRFRACRNKVCGDPCQLCPPWRPACTEPAGGPRQCGPQGLCLPVSSALSQCTTPDGGVPDGSTPIDAGLGDGGGSTFPDGGIRDGGFDGVVNEIEPNDSMQNAQFLSPAVGLPATVIASLAPAADEDWYAFIVPLGGNTWVQAVTYDQPQPYGCLVADTVLTLFDNAGTVLLENDDGAEGNCSRVVNVLPSGLYFLRVRHFNPQGTASYRLEVMFMNIGSPGDGGIRDSAPSGGFDAGTWGDGGGFDGGGGGFDGHVTGGRDGGIGLVVESEPNDSIGQATLYGWPIAYQAAIAPVGDRDVFGIPIPMVPPINTIEVRTSTDFGDPSVCIGADTRLRFFDSSGTLLAMNDDYNGIGCSLIVATVTPGQHYYVEVTHFADAAVIPLYYLHVRTP